MSDTSLYWVLLETDINNTDLYLPPDTPVGSVNPQKLYNIYQKRHARQKERLIKQQVEELYQYRRAFSIDHKDDHFIKPTSTACELISGTNFLHKESKAISQFLLEIPDYMNKNNYIKEKEYKQDNSDKIKQDCYELLTKKFKSGSETIEKYHHDQLERLENIQDLDFEAIPKEILYKMDPKKFRSYGSRVRERDRGRDRDRDRGRDKDRYRDRDRDRDRDRYRDRYRYRDGDIYVERDKDRDDKDDRDGDRKRRRKADKKERKDEYKKRDKSLSPSTPPPPKSPSFIHLKPNTPCVGIPTNLKPPTVASTSPISIPNNNNNSRPPTITTSTSGNNDPRPPTVTTSSPITIPYNNNNNNNNNNSRRPPTVTSYKPNYNQPPTVGTAQTKKYPPLFTQSTNNKPINQRRSPTPLFNNRTLKRNFKTLMDDGSLIIQNKPQRVIIRSSNGTSTVYGNPKDYDDAMNSSETRPDNPVYKRHMNGTDYLFYKTQSGNVATIGPVSKIRPLIQKFFLSM